MYVFCINCSSYVSKKTYKRHNVSYSSLHPVVTTLPTGYHSAPYWHGHLVGEIQLPWKRARAVVCDKYEWQPNTTQETFHVFIVLDGWIVKK